MLRDFSLIRLEATKRFNKLYYGQWLIIGSLIYSDKLITTTSLDINVKDKNLSENKTYVHLKPRMYATITLTNGH